MGNNEEVKKSNIIPIFIIGCVATITIVAIVIIWLFSSNKEIIITFDCNGASSIAAIKIIKGENVELPEIEKEGYIFNGWYSDEIKVTNTTTFDKDTTLKAKWIEIQVSDPALAEKYKNENWVEVNCSSATNVYDDEALIDVGCGHLNEGVIEKYKVIKIISTIYKKSNKKIIGKKESYFENVELDYGFFGLSEIIEVKLSTHFVGNDFESKIEAYGIKYND